MKHETKNNTIKTQMNNNSTNAQPTEGLLYNLLFAGKITLKEYLQVAKGKAA